MTSIVDSLDTDKIKARKKSKFDTLAREFIEHLGKTARYPLFYGGRFYLYDGNKYVEELEPNELLRTYFKSRKIPQSNNVIGNVLPIAKNLAHKSQRRYKAMPFYFGPDDTFPKTTIAYKNVIFDVEAYLAGTKTIRPHTYHWASTLCLPYDYDETATCQKWLEFLDQVLEADQDRIGLLQEWFGYCLTQDARQHTLMVLTGVPRSGKGTTMRVLSALVGTDNSTGYNLHSLGERFGLGRLVGKLVAFIGEANLTQSREKYRILETLNAIVGGDEIAIEEKQKPLTLSTVLPVKFVIACNEMPLFVDPSGALAARLLVLDYNVSFEGREDRGLGERLEAEVSGSITGLWQDTPD